MTREQATLSLDGRFLSRAGHRWLVKGIIYGPFATPLGNTSQIRQDLDAIAGLGFNSLRLYEIPQTEFLTLCQERALDVFVTLKWESGTNILGSEKERKRLARTLVQQAKSLNEVSAVAGIFVGNEVPSDLVRWLGVSQIARFLEDLTRQIRRSVPNKLLAYANYPSTEYLLPRNVDVAAYNLYLEDRGPARRYLRRLQHQAGDSPLWISEYGLDSKRAGERVQAGNVRLAYGRNLRSGGSRRLLIHLHGRMVQWRTRHAD